MSDLDEIKRLVSGWTAAERETLFRHLRQEIAIHPLEQELHARAEIILEAIRRASGVTLRMIRGVIAEAEIISLDAPVAHNTEVLLHDHQQVRLHRLAAWHEHANGRPDGQAKPLRIDLHP